MKLSDEAIQRVINTTQKRIEQEFKSVSVNSVQFTDMAFKPGYRNSADKHAILFVEGSPNSWHDVYNAINSFEFLYNGTEYNCQVSSDSNGNKGEIGIKVSVMT